MGLLSKVLSGGASDLITSVGNIADKFILTKEEKEKFNAELQAEVNRNAEAMATLAEKETEVYLADIQSARTTNTTIQESEHASWLAKNTMYILALFITTGFFGLLTYMLGHEIPTSNERIMDIMLGSLGSAWIGIISFFFGSSVGSRKNGETIRNIANNK